MTLHTNQGHEPTLEIVDKPKSDSEQLRTAKIAGRAIRDSHQKITKFLEGHEDFKGHKKLLENLKKVIEEEDKELERLKKLNLLEDRSAFEWRSKERITRFAEIKEALEKTKKGLDSLRELLKSLQKEGLLSTKHDKEVKELIDLEAEVEKKEKILVEFFKIYNKSKTKEDVVKALEQWEKDVGASDGQVNAEYINWYLNELKNHFKEIEEKSNALLTLIQEVIDADEKLGKIQPKLMEAEGLIRDLQIQWDLYEKALKKHEEVSAKKGLKKMGVMFDREVANLRAEAATISQETFDKASKKIKEILKEATTLAEQTKDLNIFKTVNSHIRARIDDYQKRYDTIYEVLGKK